MRPLNVGANLDPVTSVDQSVPELDVFHVACRSALVEAAYRLEHLATHRAESGPEM